MPVAEEQKGKPLNIRSGSTAASGAATVADAAVTEAIRLIEDAGPLDDAAAMRQAVLARTGAPERIALRASVLGTRIGLVHELSRARHGAPWVGLGLVLLIVLAGLTLAGSVTGGSER